jgi:GNAT superfamily N-acetyltransferase
MSMVAASPGADPTSAKGGETVRVADDSAERRRKPQGDAILVSKKITIRMVEPEDTALVLRFIRELAVFEKAPAAVIATEEDLRRHGFGPQRQFEAILAHLDGEPAGIALYHARFSTWLGRPGMYLEDLYVAEWARGRGVGRRLMARLAAIAVERGWERIDFHVLDWNPARNFYERLGMTNLSEWLRYGGDRDALRRLAAEDRD